MCGIFGFINGKGEALSRQSVADRMKQSLQHRGPDGNGCQEFQFKEQQILLGHTRLSVIDLHGGAQPFGDQEQSLTYNGEIFNFQDLREDLKRNVEFHTTSDTEVLFHQIKQHGIDGLTALNGMFAFAFWDQNGGELVLGRDRFGIKPLYYFFDGKNFVFASELKSLFYHPKVTKEIEAEGVASYFFSGYNLPPLTPYKNIFQLAPGHYLSWKNGKIQTYPFTTGQGLTNPLVSFEDAKRTVHHFIQDSVKRQLVSDVPLGVFLSGGIDSSIVAYEASQLISTPLQTFSIGFEEESFDESSFANTVAKHIGSKHTELKISESLLLEKIGQVLDAIHVPFADYSIIPTYILSKLARESVTVALGGDGADELFGGYPTYKAHKVANLVSFIPQLLIDNAIKPAIAKLPLQDTYQSLEWKLKRFFLFWHENRSWRHLNWMSIIPLQELSEATSFSAPLSTVERMLKSLPHVSHINQALQIDQNSYLFSNVLTKVDTASMAHSLEVRPPFLDNNLAAYVTTLPDRFKLNGFTTKYLLKKLYENKLPHEILYRSKHGFSVSLAKWLRGPLKDLAANTVSDSNFLHKFGLNPAYFQRKFDKHIRSEEDNSRILWATIVLKETYARLPSA